MSELFSLGGRPVGALAGFDLHEVSDFGMVREVLVVEHEVVFGGPFVLVRELFQLRIRKAVRGDSFALLPLHI